jgi:hypothetical protein
MTATCLSPDAVVGERFDPDDGLEEASGLRPDIIGVRRNGLVDAFEAMSKSDTKAALIKRLQQGVKTLPAKHQGSVAALPLPGGG